MYLKGWVIGLAMLVAAVVGSLAGGCWSERVYEDQVLKNDRVMSYVAGVLDAQLHRTAVVLVRDSARADSIRTLHTAAVDALTRSRTPGRVPPRPITPAPDTCGAWIEQLTAELTDAERRRTDADTAATRALDAEQRATGRADDLAAELGSVRNDLAIARDSLANRPLPVPTHRGRPKLALDASSSLQEGRLFAGLTSGPLYAGVEQRLAYTADRTSRRQLVAGVRWVF